MRMKDAGFVAIVIVNVCRLVLGNLKETVHLEDNHVVGR